MSARVDPVTSSSAGLEEAMRAFPGVLENLRDIYGELRGRADRVERQLVATNSELEARLVELETLRAHLEAVLESLPCGFIERDAEGTITRINGVAQELLSVSDELVGAREHPGLPESAPAGTPREHVRADGHRIVLASHPATVRLTDGTLSGSIELLEDHTEREALWERLHAADKMAALGTLTAGVAHEIRNPLNAVKGFAALLQRALAGGASPIDVEKLRLWAGHISDGASEMDLIIENMLSFGSPERLRSVPIDGAELLEEAVEAAITDRPDDVADRIDIDRVADLPPFRGDRIKLRQALRNLLENAIHVQPEGGRIRLRLTLEGQEVVALVSDAGPGIPAEVRGRILDPFFTTHASGTGLGLALVSTIARLHGGELRVSSQPSDLGGAEFALRIPYQSADAADAPSSPVETR